MVSGDEELKRYFSAIVMFVVLCSLAVSGRAMIAEKDDIPDIPSISPEGYEAIRADVLNPAPANFTIDLRKFANIGVDENAPVFAIYTGSSLPTKCGDFRDMDIPTWNPAKYKRAFNLTGKEKVVRAFEGYGCVVLRHSPSEG